MRTELRTVIAEELLASESVEPRGHKRIGIVRAVARFHVTLIFTSLAGKVTASQVREVAHRGPNCVDLRCSPRASSTAKSVIQFGYKSDFLQLVSAKKRVG